MKFSSFFILVLTGGLLCAAPASANSLLISPNPNQGQRFPTQGDCSRNGISISTPNIDLTRATWACTGASQQMMKIFYREGPQECVYIDNFNNDDGQLRAFFVPLNTSDEWSAFAANLPGGVRLRHGCPGGVAQDPCGHEFVLPDAPASDNPEDRVRIRTELDYEAEYICPVAGQGPDGQALNVGCGEWQKVKESGNCGITHIPEHPGGPETPPIPIPGTTSDNGGSGDGAGILPAGDTGGGGGETTGILPIDSPTPPLSIF